MRGRRSWIRQRRPTRAWVPPPLALPTRAVLFTTTFIPPDPTEELEMLSNWCFHLQQAGVLEHTLILTVGPLAPGRLCC